MPYKGEGNDDSDNGLVWTPVIVQCMELSAMRSCVNVQNLGDLDHFNWLVNSHDRSEEPGGARNQVGEDELKACVVGLGEYVERLCQST